MTLYTNSEKLTELFGLDGNFVKISSKLIFFGELKAWKRTVTATHNFLDVETVYTKSTTSIIGKFIYNDKGEMYIVSDGENEYCYYVKSFNEVTNEIVISYDTYDNIKKGQLSNEYPLGEEAISYSRDADSDITL